MLAILDGLRIGEGDHVLSTAYTIRPLVSVLRSLGLDLELVDISPEDCNLDVDDLSRRLRPDTRAVIVTHIFGTPARMDEIRALLSGHGCALIEDAAHAHGAAYGGARCGSLGDAAFFSFDQVKPLSTFGGGMVVTDRSSLAERVRTRVTADPFPSNRYGAVAMSFIEQALVNSPVFSVVTQLNRVEAIQRGIAALYRGLDRRPAARNLRLSPLQAYVGVGQLTHLEERLETRRGNAGTLAARCRGLVPQQTPEGAVPSRHKFVLMAPGDSRRVRDHMLRRGIDVGIKDDVNQPCHRELSLPDADYPGTTAVYERLVEVPAYETLDAVSLETIAAALAEIE